MITHYTDPTVAYPEGITAGPDGALWFTNARNGSIGRITTAGTITNITDSGNNQSVQPSISADGSSVVFTTYSTNLEEGVTHPSIGWSDIALWHI